MLNTLLRGLVALAAMVLAQAIWAQEDKSGWEPGSAHAVVEQVTVELLDVVRKEKHLLDTEPGKYFSQVKSVLQPVVDFDFIARNVMGPYWKDASAQQRKDFIETFRDGLVETYAKGMANYADLDIRLLPPSKESEDKSRVGVVQEITGPDGVNRVSYTMARNREGEWKLINMVLNGVNLGKTFRNQFAQAAKQHDGKISAVINNWSAET